MTISSTTNPRVQYAGAGSTGPFTVSFPFVLDGDLTVIKTDTSGVDSTLVITTNYTVTGGGIPATTGSVTLVVALAVGEVLTILRETAQTQGTDYIENDTFPAESHESALDKVTLITQELNSKVNRAMTLGPTSVLTSVVLPDPNALDILRWNAAADNLENVGAASVGVLTAGTGISIISNVVTYSGALSGNSDVTITGATKGDTFVYNGTAWVDLTVGTNNQVLTADSGQATGLKWDTPVDALEDLSNVVIGSVAKGELMAHNGSVWTDVPIGTNDYVLTADSGGASGMNWKAITTTLVNDTAPQLGGDLDTNNFDIMFDNSKGIRDNSDNRLLLFGKVGSATNYLKVTNASTGNDVLIEALGGDTSVDLAILPKGTGKLIFDGLNWPTSDGSANNIIKTDGSGNLTFVAPTQVATQAEQETGTSTTTFVSPGRQQYHESAAKAWCLFDGSGAVGIDASYNITSIADIAVGKWELTLTTAFSSVNYACAGSAVDSIALGDRQLSVFPSTASVIKAHSGQEATSNLFDAGIVSFCAFGDQ